MKRESSAVSCPTVLMVQDSRALQSRQDWMPPHSTCNSLTLSTDDACTALLGLSTSSFLCPQIIGKYHYSHVTTEQENVCMRSKKLDKKEATSCIEVIFRTPSQLPPKPAQHPSKYLFSFPAYIPHLRKHPDKANNLRKNIKFRCTRKQ